MAAGAAAGGATAMGGGAGWVNVGGGGPDAGPDGGARLTAAPGSGTEAGGTGGGRSENIWAEAGPGKTASQAATDNAAPSPLAHPLPVTPLPLQIMAMLFTENAANSSLRDPGGRPA